ncbi:MAG: penicillin acylase family protein [Rhodobacterales bacterium]|nr:MAG: penicillin acylase family protein [Rhodobacterales bacterium]
MDQIFKWLLRLAFAIIALALAGLSGAYYLASRSLPDYNAEATVHGISAPVEILRNNNNIPHIFGATDDDVFFGLGYAHAQDRLWQMIMLRRTVQGRLSEFFGPRSFQTDDLMRRLDLYHLAQEAVAVQTPETLAALEAYAHGVNAWLDQVNQGALGRGAPELFLFSNDISPWVPADSIAVMKLLAVQMSGQVQEEVLRARTALMLPDDRLFDILPDAPGTGIVALPEYSALFNATRADFPALAQVRPAMPEDPLSPLPARGMAGASNAFAAAPDRTTAGGALLANDPHLKLTAPTLWYLARLELSTGGVIGATVPGMPVILAGRSADFGWGITGSYMDNLDVFIEEVNPDNPSELRTPEGYAPMRERQTIIRIKDEAPRTITLRWSENGPVLPGEHYGLAAVTPPGHVAALGWTLLTAEDRSVSAAMALMRAGSVEEGIKAGADFVGPTVNLTLADKDSIGFKTIGAMPRRDAGHMTLGRMPAPGWERVNRWLGLEPYAANPEFINPAGGIIGNTNNKTVERPFPLHVSWDWGDTQRVQRWQRLMAARRVHTRESFIDTQLDRVSITARTLLPLVGADLWFTGEAAPAGTRERARQEALSMLAAWNGEMDEYLPEPLIYAAWMRALQERLIRDELGPLADAYTHVEPLFIERVFRDVNGAGIWCDVVQSAAKESCTDMARAALDDALIWLEERYGGTLSGLRWGDAHVATQDHPVLGHTPYLGWLVNIRQSTSGGDNTLMRGLTAGTGTDPFRNVHGAGYRGVYDFADPDSSLFITSTGQSGHFLSRHYDDLGELWRRGEYVPMSLDTDLARAAAVGTTLLIPAP